MRVTIKAGPTNSMTQDFPAGTTVGQAITNPRIVAGLQISGNMRPIIDGVEQGLSSPLRDGDVIELETRASTKN